MKMTKALRPNRDVPQLEGINLNAQAGAGSGADYEHAIVALPNLALGAPSGLSGAVPQNAMQIRWILIVFEANLTGANTNNVTYNVNQRRNGLPLVNTTSATTISAGLQTVTPASMANIMVGMKLTFSGGTGATEVVTVASVNASAGTFTAVFANGHSGAYTIVSAPLATITFASGTNATAWVPVQLAAYANNYIAPGDTVTLQRVSAGSGLATPALTVWIDWESYLTK